MAQETNKLASDRSLEKVDEFDSFDSVDETEEIKAKIEETRKNMGDTIDEIQERLSFSNLSEQVSEQVNNAIETAKDSVYEATIGKAVNFMKHTGNDITGTAVVKSIKSNPLPYALIGIGSGLLLYKNFAGSKRTPAGFDTRNFASSNDVRGTLSAVGSRVSGAVDTVSTAASSAAGTVSSAAGSAVDTVSGAANSTLTGARDLASKAYEKAGEFGTTAHETYDHYIEENPLAVGAIALAVGAAVGFAIPSTRYESQLVGETRNNLLSKAEEAAGGLVEKAKQVAAGAGSTIAKEVKNSVDAAIPVSDKGGVSSR